MSETKIFVMTHKKFPEPDDPIYLPLQVGAAENGRLGYLSDDTGDNISAENHLWGELTGMYWIWKNYDGPEKYIGINHYRRYFINEKHEFLGECEIERIMGEYDMIASKTNEGEQTYYEAYAEAHNAHDLGEVGRSLERLYPEYSEAFKAAISSHRGYAANLMITTREQYNAYCEWLFAILSDANKSIDVSGYDLYHARVLGFLSEGMLLVWALHHHLRVFEAEIGYTDEKAETKELKLAIGKMIKDGLFDEAEKLFNEIMTVRPDIGLRLSDIRQEIPVIQQILYIGNQERIRGIAGIYEESHDLNQLIALYGDYYRALQRIGEAGEDNAKGACVEADLEWLRMHHFTAITLEVMLHYDMCSKYGTKPLNESAVRARTSHITGM